MDRATGHGGADPGDSPSYRIESQLLLEIFLGDNKLFGYDLLVITITYYHLLTYPNKY